MQEDADQTTDAGQNPEAEAASIAAEDRDVRGQVRDLFVRLFREREAGLEEISDVARRVIDGSLEGAERAASDRSDQIVREAVEGLADGYASAANATRLAFEEAAQRGKSLAEEDLNKALKELGNLQSQFVDSVTQALKRARGEMGSELEELKTHASRVGERLQPAIRSAVEAARQHPGAFASGATAAGVAATREAAGTLLKAVSGALDGASDLVRGEGNDPRGRSEG